MPEQRQRLRDHSVVIGVIQPGPLNSITDVDGVAVGHATVWEGEAPGSPGHGPARTGVTAVVPHPGNLFRERLFSGFYALNGYGELTSRSVIEEWGLLGSPILLTSSHSLGTVHEATVRYLCKRDAAIGDDDVALPVVAECDDSFLNDSRGFHVRTEHVEAALESASNGPTAEGTVGAGTGMECFGWKGGIGTASRVITARGATWTIGVLALTNFGSPPNLIVAGVPVGQRLVPPGPARPEHGSCIVVVATDAPLDSQQCSRLAKRASLGLGRMGSIGADDSGELVIAFSTAHRVPRSSPTGTFDHSAVLVGQMGQEDHPIDALFAGVIEATEEAALDSLFTASTVSGRGGHVLYELPIGPTLDLLRSAGRL